MYTVSFKNRQGNSVVVYINDGSSSTVELTPSSTPLITERTDSEDYFDPIRYTTGSINVLMNPQDVISLCASKPINRRVTIKINGQFMWRGFLQCSAFTQSFSSELEEVSLPIVSMVGLLKSMRPSNDVSTFRQVSLATFLCEIDTMFQASANESYYHEWVVPGSNSTAGEGWNNLLTTFHLSAFAEWDEESGEYKMSTYYEILENLMRAFGWTLFDEGYDMYLLNNNVNAKNSYHVAYNKSRLAAVGRGESTTGSSYIRGETNILQYIDGCEHKLDVIQGKRSVSVSIPEVDRSSSFFSFNIDSYGARINQHRSVALSPANVYESVLYKGKNGVSIENNTSSIPVDVQISEKNGNTIYGGCLLQMRHRNPINQEVPGFTPCVVMRHIKTTEYTGELPLSIDTHSFLRSSNVYSDSYLRLNATADCRSSITDDWEAYNGTISVVIGVTNNGSNNYWQGNSLSNTWSSAKNKISLTFKDGNLVNTDYSKAATYGQGALIACNSDKTEGRIFMEFHYRSSDDKPKFLRIKSLSLVGCQSWMAEMSFKSQDVDINKKHEEIYEMYEEDYDVTLALSDLSWNGMTNLGLLYNQYKKVFISFTQTIFEKYKNYYSKCHSVLTIDRYRGGVHNPLNYYVFGDTIGRTCLYYSKDWKTGYSTAKFYEDN